MASFKKTANNKWQATISCGRDSKNKQIRKYITKDTLKEAKAAAREIELEYEEGLLVNVKNIRLSSWMEQWLEFTKNRISTSTYQSYKIYVNVHFKPELGNLRLQQINEVHIQKYVGKKLEKLSPTTVRKHLFVLREILQDALKHKNPAKDVKVPSQKGYKPHIVTNAEFNKIFEVFKGHKYEAIILLAAWCGLRRGEIFALKWDDIDWESKTIRVDESRVISEDGYIDKGPKSANGYRIIAAPEYILDLLKEIKKNGIKERIFTGRPDNLTHRFKEIIENAGLKNIRFHDLRHYHASWLYKNNIPDHHAAQRLGHDIQTLKKIYQHIDADTNKQIDKKIINMLESSGN